MILLWGTPDLPGQLPFPGY